VIIGPKEPNARKRIIQNEYLSGKELPKRKLKTKQSTQLPSATYFTSNAIHPEMIEHSITRRQVAAMCLIMGLAGILMHAQLPPPMQENSRSKPPKYLHPKKSTSSKISTGTETERIKGLQ